MAGVEPRFVQFDGEDADGYAFDVNRFRRHMSKGAQAMVVAMRYPDADKRGRGNKAAKSEIISDFNERLVQQARLVLRVTPTIAAAVRDGEKPLAAAYDEAKVIEAERS